MRTVEEIISSEPMNYPDRAIVRDEELLFTPPPEAAMRFLNPDLPRLAVYSFPMQYSPQTFGPPQGVFESDILRLEWQTIHGRQPFYHRNIDVDEIGYQICGERTLMTECGVVEFEPGQFCRIPMGVAHDNYGREDIHLIIYLHGPTEACIPPVARGRHLVPPYPGWENTPRVEAITNGLGAPDSSIAYSMADEQMILDAASRFPDSLEVLQPDGRLGETQWVYKTPKIWIGHTRLGGSLPRRYRRRLVADEIQFQVKGSRTILSQRGVVTLNPGDFTCIPMGCSYASVAEEDSEHLSWLTPETVPPARAPDHFADANVLEWLALRDDAPGEVQ